MSVNGESFISRRNFLKNSAAGLALFPAAGMGYRSPDRPVRNTKVVLVKTGDRITIKPADKSQNLVRARLEELGEPSLQNWLSLDIPKLEGSVLAMPSRDDVMIPVEENLIVELCSR